MATDPRKDKSKPAPGPAAPGPGPAPGRRGAPATDFGVLPGDLLRSTEVKEGSSDSAWAMFNQISEQQNQKFADTLPGVVPSNFAPSTTDPLYAATQPQGLPSTRDSEPAPLQPVPALTIEIVMVEARRNNRVCPRPRRWQQLYDMLPNKREVKGKLEPPPPTVGASWNQVPALAKRLCFREHLEWAEKEGRLLEVFAFIKALTEEEWFHMGDE